MVHRTLVPVGYALVLSLIAGEPRAAFAQGSRTGTLSGGGHQRPFGLSTEATVNLEDGSITGSSVPLTLPGGKRFVVEHLSVHSAVPAGQKPFLFMTTDNHLAASIPVESQGQNLFLADVFRTSHLVRLYLDATATHHLQFTRNLTAGAADAVVVLTGYLIDLP